MSTENGELAGTTTGHRPIFIDPASKCMCTTNPENGQVMWIIDQETGQPLSARSVYVDPASGCLCAADPVTNKVSWIIDPATGRPMAGNLDQAESAAVPSEQSAQVEEEPAGQSEDVAQVSSDAQIDAGEAADFAAQSVPDVQQGVEAAVAAALVEEGESPQDAAVVAEGEAAVRDARPVEAEKLAEPFEPAKPAEASGAVGASSEGEKPAEAVAAAGAASEGEKPADVAPVVTRKPVSAMAVASLILGLLAVAAAVVPAFVDVPKLLPSVNAQVLALVESSAAFAIVVVGLLFALIGTHGIQKGVRRGEPAAIIGVVLCIIAVSFVLVSQYLYPQAFSGFNGAASQANTTATTSSQTAGSANATRQQGDSSALAVGQSYKLDNGLTLTVNSVKFDLENFDGSHATMVNVTYVNNGTANRTFNVYDWKALDGNGALRSATYFAKAENELQSGDLTPGGTVSGNIYFDGSTTKVYYYDNIVKSESNIGWVLR